MYGQLNNGRIMMSNHKKIDIECIDEVTKKLSQASSICHLLNADSAHKTMSPHIVDEALWAVTDLVEDAKKIVTAL